MSANSQFIQIASIIAIIIACLVLIYTTYVICVICSNKIQRRLVVVHPILPT